MYKGSNVLVWKFPLTLIKCSILLFIVSSLPNALTKLMLTHSYLCHLSSRTTPQALCHWVQMALRRCNQSPMEKSNDGLLYKVLNPLSLGGRAWDCRTLHSRGLWIQQTLRLQILAHTRQESAIVLDTDQQNAWPCTFTKSPEPSRPLIGLIFRHTGIGWSNESFSRS